MISGEICSEWRTSCGNRMSIRTVWSVSKLSRSFKGLSMVKAYADLICFTGVRSRPAAVIQSEGRLFTTIATIGPQVAFRVSLELANHR